ncbi:hypothetical protein FFLO_02274 [Filobasidium floriforme]|uniref:EF-hand domain-containing protein n=1 Tax=Filobasidium floriforme TaxID=5210 RepID=A0A8K0JT50_9TREE|nr:hypothetical protein FFLO_02274 [Filobasidium floriforme]
MQSPGGSGGYGLREGARDAYMGAGAYDSRTGRYGPSATPAFPPQHQHQYQQQPQQQQGAGGPQGGYGSPQTQSRQPGGYGQPYPQPPYQQPPQQQQQRPVTAQPPPPQAPTGPYPLVERPSRSPQPGQQPQHHQQAYPYVSSPSATSPPHYPNPTSSPYAPHHTHTPSPAQLANSSAASPGYYQTTSPGASGPIPTVVNPNQLQTRPPVQAQGQGQGGQAPRRQDSKDSAGGQELWEMFSSMDLRRTGQLGNKEVMELLSRDSRWRITPREDCVKMTTGIFDSDRSGFISFSEFEGLWAYIKDWHKIFLRFDRDNSGTIDRSELDQALQSFGYPLPRDLVRKLEKRFAAPPKDSGGSVPRGITFDRFLMACVTVKHFTEAFRRRDARNEGKLTIDYNTFVSPADAPTKAAS